jgi:hypothetical protein
MVKEVKVSFYWYHFYLFIYLFIHSLIFETRSHYVAQVDLKISSLLPQPQVLGSQVCTTMSN